MFRRHLAGAIRSYFNLSSRERSGLLVLAAILLIHLSILLYQRYAPIDSGWKELQSDIRVTSFVEEITQQEAILPEKIITEKTAPPRSLFYFDPNTIDATVWQQLGLSAKQAASIEKYIKGGGRINRPSDLRKLYVLNEATCSRLEPFVRIKEASIAVAEKKPEVILTLDLNVADSSQLVCLKGVGPGRARLICRYRDALGGFVTTEQLKEVYSIDSAVYQQLVPQIKIDASIIRKLSVNTDTLRHPYISRKAACMLVSYRNQHGSFHTVSDLLKSKAIDSVALHRLAPYLTFE